MGGKGNDHKFQVHSNTMSKEKQGGGMKRDTRRKVPREPLKVLIRKMTWSMWFWEVLDKTLHRKPEAPCHHLTTSSLRKQLGVTGSGYQVLFYSMVQCIQVLWRIQAQRKKAFICKVLGSRQGGLWLHSLLTEFPRSPPQQLPLPLNGQSISWLSLVTRETGKCDILGGYAIISNKIRSC